MAAIKIRRVSLVRIFFLFLLINLFAPLQMFNVEISWNFGTVVQKNISVFYPIFHETFSNSCGFGSSLENYTSNNTGQHEQVQRMLGQQK